MPDGRVPAEAGAPGRKLLIAATIPETISAFLLPYVTHLRQRGWQVDGLAHGITSSAACREAFSNVIDVPWSRQPLDPRNFIAAPGQIRRLVEREGYGVVHVHTPVAGFVTRFALRARPAGVKVVYTAHGFHFHSGGPRLRNLVFTSLEWIAGRWTDELIVINSEDRRAAEKAGLVESGRLHHLPGIGVDTLQFSGRESYAREARLIRATLSLPDDARLVTMVAEFIPRKRHADAVEAVARLADESVHLLLAGAGPLTEEVRALAGAAGLGARTHFLGFRSDIPALLAASDVLLLPSLQEGLPRSVLEAMSMGVPVIATRIRGVTDLLAGGAGLLVPVRSPQAIARALHEVFTDSESRLRMQRLAAGRVKEFDIQGLLAWHEQLYEGLLGSREAAGLLSGPRFS
jgi:glycosyltransferase involved in cell wall biosynthesis